MQSGTKLLHGGLPQRNAAQIAGLAVQMDTSGAGVEHHIANLDPDDLRHARAGVVRQQEQGMIMLAQP